MGLAAAQPDGDVATELRETATGTPVSAQRAYDPYGAPDEGGTAKTEGEPDSPLGFQAAPRDDVTGNVFLGPRIYDPKINRFTTADYFVGSSSDLSLGTDPLTGNRYLFAAANPVAFYENGYRPECEDGGSSCAASWYKPQAVRQRSRAMSRQRASSADDRTNLSEYLRPASVLQQLRTLAADLMKVRRSDCEPHPAAENEECEEDDDGGLPDPVLTDLTVLFMLGKSLDLTAESLRKYCGRGDWACKLKYSALEAASIGAAACYYERRGYLPLHSESPCAPEDDDDREE